MLKVQHVIGLPVIEVETGKQLGIVKDFAWTDSGNLLGLVLSTTRLVSALRWVPWDELVAIGDDVVTVYHADSVHVWEEGPQRLLCSGKGKLISLPAVTFDGQQVGLIEDVYFQENLETPIVGIELSDGLISDLTKGRKWLPVSDGFKYGEDSVLVPAQSDKCLKALNNLGRK